MKPNDEKRNRNILAKIEQNLAQEPEAEETIYVYKFDDVFAGLHHQDAMAIVAFNREQLAGRIDVKEAPGADATAEQLSGDSLALTNCLGTARQVGHGRATGRPRL